MSTTTKRRKRAVRAQADPVLHRRAKESRSLAKRTVEDIIKIRSAAHRREETHPTCGLLLCWSGIEWSADTAANFMRVFRFSQQLRFRKVWNLKIAPAVIYALARAPGDVADDIFERIKGGERLTVGNVKKEFAKVVVRHRAERIVAPYYNVTKPTEPPRIVNAEFVPRKPMPQITEEESYPVGLRGGANRLINALAHTRPDVREKAPSSRPYSQGAGI